MNEQNQLTQLDGRPFCKFCLKKFKEVNQMWFCKLSRYAYCDNYDCKIANMEHHPRDFDECHHLQIIDFKEKKEENLNKIEDNKE